MPPRRPFAPLLAALLAALGAGAPLAAEEGMWPLNRLPLDRLERALGYRPAPDLLERLRGAAVRISGIGSGAFVSPDGLLLTNQHLVAGCLRDLSSDERDLRRDGFLATSRVDELPCPGFEVHQLEAIETVTARVRAAVPAAAPAAAAAAAMKSEMAAIEQECATAAGARCEVATLYQGGEYDLYRYRRATDVRLVFVPENRFARFGGDEDNFDYPRYAFDVALLRVYVDGRPLASKRHLRLSRRGPAAGETLLLAGYPAATGRRMTVAQLEWLRDVAYPTTLAHFEHLRSRLLEATGREGNFGRLAADDLESVENALKAMAGFLSGLLDPERMDRARARERALRAAVAADPELAARIGDPWTELETALDSYRSFFARAQAVDRGLAGAGSLAWIARTLVRLAEERERPNGERLREYREAVLPTLLGWLRASYPIDRDYEAFRLGHGLRQAASQLGPTHPIARTLFADRSPEEVAAAAVAGTRLDDPAVRRALVDGGRTAIEGCGDPLLQLARAFEPLARELRDRAEREVEAVERMAGERLAKAAFAVGGHDLYPDANFTFRISWGELAGYQEGGRNLEPFTRFAGLFARAADKGGRPPFDPPPAVAAAMTRLDLGTPLDFVTNQDISGGSSGSPVVDRRGELVGVVFDGNLWQLPNRFVYAEEKARAIAVDSRAILEALEEIYRAPQLVRELAAAPGG